MTEQSQTPIEASFKFSTAEQRSAARKLVEQARVAQDETQDLGHDMVLQESADEAGALKGLVVAWTPGKGESTDTSNGGRKVGGDATRAYVDVQAREVYAMSSGLPTIEAFEASFDPENSFFQELRMPTEAEATDVDAS